MERWKGKIDCPERMLEAIRHYGIVPFFKCGIPGWSIEEMTPRECWFFSSDQLGPWDWKIDVIQSGEIAYGKFMQRKAAFATAEYYGHLLNWRRAQQKYALVPQKPRTVNDRLNALMAPVTMEAIQEFGAVESSELRQMLEERVPAELRKGVGGHMEKYLLPKVKKQALEFVLQHLEMGCYVITGDFRRVYRGHNAEYSGWQRASLTTPEAMFGADCGKPSEAGASPDPGGSGHVCEGKKEAQNSDVPFWAKFIDDSSASEHSPLLPSCTPEESYRILSERLESFFPGCLSGKVKPFD